MHSPAYSNSSLRGDQIYLAEATSQTRQPNRRSRTSTMDPFTISTGVAGFLSLAIELTKILKTYISEVKDAPQEASTLLETLEPLVEVLENFREFLEDDEISDAGLSFKKDSALVKVVDVCEKCIRTIRDQLKGFPAKGKDSSTLRRKFERLKWPFQKEDLV